MNKLSKKFVIGIIAVLFLSTLFSTLLNQQFAEKYYLYQKRRLLDEIGGTLTERLERGAKLSEAAALLEDERKVLIVYTENISSDNDMLNLEIRNAFHEKGIGFQKFWLWEDDYQKVIQGKTKMRLYSQEKLNYSLLVEYMLYRNTLISIVMIVPNIGDAFAIMNTFSLCSSILTILAAIAVIIMLIRKITSPLKQFEQFASDMGQNQYTPLEIHTGDELEQVAKQLNSMGNRILSYQATLKEKNAQMEQLLDDVTHDLKTPVSLIKLYANGIKDGFDDGGFLDTIIYENTQMEQMINTLLFLTRIDKEAILTKKCDISRELLVLLDEYAILIKEQQQRFIPDIEENLIIETNREWLKSIFCNLITNAIKYSSGKEIEISLKKQQDSIAFSISNESDNEKLDTAKLWNPYYVGEESRNKNLSGSGLGLPIVKKLTDKLHYGASCTLQDQRITFIITIPCT